MVRKRLDGLERKQKALESLETARRATKRLEAEKFPFPGPHPAPTKGHRWPNVPSHQVRQQRLQHLRWAQKETAGDQV